ncbi:hypothetical protein SK128_024516 [Halocaridina rubra]|uniref:C2H2-type domain-containing protein n=1 Tax=Halocaridina rubra TaxID=373956 RepID=A0AAN8WLH7_HALRR
MVENKRRAGVGDLGGWERRALLNPPWVSRGMVGTWGRSRRGPRDVLRDGNDATDNLVTSNSVSNVGPGILLDILGRNEDHNPPQDSAISLPTHAGGRLCPVCGRYISNPSNLRKHMHRAHGTRSFFCPACHKSYRVVCDLRRHVLAAHNIRMDSANTHAMLPSLQSSDHPQSVVRGDVTTSQDDDQVSGEEETNHPNPLHHSEASFLRTPTPEVGLNGYISTSSGASVVQADSHLMQQNGFPSLEDSGTLPAALV